MTLQDYDRLGIKMLLTIASTGKFKPTCYRRRLVSELKLDSTDYQFVEEPIQSVSFTRRSDAEAASLRIAKQVYNKYQNQFEKADLTIQFAFYLNWLTEICNKIKADL